MQRGQEMAFAVYGFSELHSLNMSPGHEGMQVLRLRACPWRSCTHLRRMSKVKSTYPKNSLQHTDTTSVASWSLRVRSPRPELQSFDP